MEFLKYEESNLSPEIKKALKEYNFVEATLIQQKAIPAILDGNDLIAQSQTGTGKTAAYTLPILEKIDKNLKKVQTIILCPTRELAVQVVGEIRKFAKYEEGIKTLAIYGGESIERQIIALKHGVQIVVGTPGRVLDHMRRKTLKLNNVNTVVLDEADEMLNMGFEEDIRTVLSEVPEERQVVLFSATMNKRILEIAKKYLVNPTEIKIPVKELTVDKIKQYSIELKQAMKEEALSRIMDCNQPKKCVVFCNTKRKVDELIESLKKKGYKAESLHGDVKQEQRERIMKRFKNGDYQVMIATDVAARGIDVEDLDLVVNYDVPQEEEYYVHRIGRTGRNGNDGKAYTFVVGKERQKLMQIEKYAKTKIFPAEIPSEEDMKEIKQEKITNKIQNMVFSMKEKPLENEILENVYKELKTNNQEEDIIKALLQMAVGKESQINRLNTSLPKKDKFENKSNEKRSNRKKDSLNSNNKRFFISLGRIDTIKPKDLVGTIVENTSVSANEIGKIDIMDKFSFIEVPYKYEKNMLENLNGKILKGKEVRLEVAKKR